MANLGSVAKMGLSIEIDFSVSAIATVRNPSLCNSLGEPSNQAHGIRKTAPIETLTARRFNGSQELRVSNMASIPRAAAERKIAPMLVVSTTPSMTAFNPGESPPLFKTPMFIFGASYSRKFRGRLLPISFLYQISREAGQTPWDPSCPCRKPASFPTPASRWSSSAWPGDSGSQSRAPQ